MADQMAQVQREMDSFLGSFGFPTADPFDMLERAAVAPLVARRSLPAAGSLTRLLPLVSPVGSSSGGVVPLCFGLGMM
jgi:hypothetical protein